MRQQAIGSIRSFQRFQSFQTPALSSTEGFHRFPSTLHRDAQDGRFVPVVPIVCDGKNYSPVGAFEIILQGAFEKPGDLIGVVAERTTTRGAKYDAVMAMENSNSKTEL